MPYFIFRFATRLRLHITSCIIREGRRLAQRIDECGHLVGRRADLRGGLGGRIDGTDQIAALINGTDEQKYDNKTHSLLTALPILQRCSLHFCEALAIYPSVLQPDASPRLRLRRISSLEFRPK